MVGLVWLSLFFVSTHLGAGNGATDALLLAGGVCAAAALIMLTLNLTLRAGAHWHAHAAGKALGGACRSFAQEISEPEKLDGRITTNEAAALFADARDLTTTPHADASLPPANGKRAATLFGLVIAGLALAGGVFGAGAPLSGLSAALTEAPPAALSQTPWLIAGGAVFLFAGFVVDLASRNRAPLATACMRGAAERGFTQAGGREALASLETARTNGAKAIEKTRTFANQSPAYAALSESETGPGNFDDEGLGAPSWRNRDLSVRHVETGFAAAPAPWRTDAFAKKFEASARREPASKRRPQTRKKRARH